MKTRLLLIASALAVSVSGVRAQGTAFTYQGRLNDGAGPASGTYDLQFAIYDSTNIPGVLVAGPITNSAANVSNGLFTATLDFGSGVFDGPPRFLEIAVRTNGGVGFIVLAPRQPLTPSPYAIFANTASNLAGTLPSGDLSGPYSGPVQFNNGSDVFDGTFNGQFFGSTFTGGIFTGNFLGSGSGLSDVWHTTGNMGTTPANFLGTTDNQPLMLKVYGQEVMRYESSPETPNIIGGWSGNYVQPGLAGVTIGGGGSATLFQGFIQPNVVTNNGNYGVIAGGYHNMVTGYGGTILGGSVNWAAGNFATILGGQFNTNAANYAVIGGGFGNIVTSNLLNGFQPYYSVIGGGYANVADGGWSVIGGGYFNTNRGVSAFIGSGDYNFLDGNYSAIGGGVYNQASGFSSFIGGGYRNTISTNEGAIAGGVSNTNNGYFSFIGAGDNNLINSEKSVIGGGELNFISSNSVFGTIPGGANNTIQTGAISSTIGGGYGNTIQGGAFNSIIGGGFTNTISSNAADVTISGGSFNVIGPGANLSVISGGTGHQVNGAYSFVGGGIANTANGFLSTSVGGQGNAALYNNTTIVGGLFNTNYGVLSFMGGGDNNFSAGFGSVISGGESNRTGGFFSMASGYHAGALHDGTFVWSDYEPANFFSTSSNQFLIRAQNGVGINTNNPQAALHVNGNIMANNFIGNGVNLSGLNFSQLSGTLLDGQLSGAYSSAVTFNNAGNSFAGNGSSLTALNASQLTSGTVADARLSTNVALLNRDPQTFTGQNNFSGNIVMTDPTKSISFPATSGANAPMITMFASGSANADRMVIAHSATFSNWGLQYQDSSDTFNFLNTGTSIMNISLGSGRVGIGAPSPTARFQVVNATCDGNSWLNASDRNLKENFAPVEPLSVLAKVAELSIQKWNYKSEPTQTHLGPVAQDFRAAFELGADDRHIATVDEGGVALAAIQGLNQKVEEQRGELKEKESEIADLKQRLEKLEQLMSRRDGGAK